MTSILDQFEDELPKESSKAEAPDVVKKQRKSRVKVDKLSNEDIPSDTVEEMREKLSILAVLGTVERYTGVKMSLGDVKRLTAKDVATYYNRYQICLGSQVSGSLIGTVLETGVELLTRLVSIDNKTELISDLKKNELLTQVLTDSAGYLILKGGRMVCLASALIQIGKHIDFSGTKTPDEDDMEQYIEKTVRDSLKES